MVAIDENRNAYEIVNGAVLAYLRRANGFKWPSAALNGLVPAKL
jgi:hypothetical protein